MAEAVVPTREVRAALGQITKRFDAGDPEPVFFGPHRRAQAVLVPISTGEKLLAHAEDELDLELARRRLADRRSWLSEEDLDAALVRAGLRGATRRDRRPNPVRYRLGTHPDVPADLVVLAAAHGTQALTAARAALDDLARRRVTGKLLGARRVSGDLTGLAGVTFDIPESPTRRCRLVYGDVDADSRSVLAIGVRDEHATARLAVERPQAGAAEEPSDGRRYADPAGWAARRRCR